MKRSRIASSDLPPSIARSWRKAERAARRKKFGRAQKELTRTLKKWPSIRKLPMSLIKRKFSRVKRIYLRSKSKLSPQKNQMVLQAIIKGQMAIGSGSAQKANIHLNQALKNL